MSAIPGISPRVIVLTTFDVDQYVYTAFAAGASGFLLKDVITAVTVSRARAARCRAGASQ